MMLNIVVTVMALPLRNQNLVWCNVIPLGVILLIDPSTVNRIHLEIGKDIIPNNCDYFLKSTENLNFYIFQISNAA